jgi:ProP effector
MTGVARTAPPRIERRDALLAAMRVIWPNTIGACLPLKIGVHEDIAAEFPEVSKKLLRSAMFAHTHLPKYKKALTRAGAKRHNLSGEPVGDVSEQDRAFALRDMKRIRKFKKAGNPI